MERHGYVDASDDLNDLDHGGVNLQCSVDDALNLVHDVVLRKQVLKIPEEKKQCFQLFLEKTSEQEPVGRQSGEGNGGSAVEAEDGVGRRHCAVRRLHRRCLQ